MSKIYQVHSENTKTPEPKPRREPRPDRPDAVIRREMQEAVKRRSSMLKELAKL